MTEPGPEGPCKECLSMSINWGQIGTIALGVTAGLLLAGLLARVAR
jgi:hypothetical protein